jgi:hypothetical protein
MRTNGRADRHDEAVFAILRMRLMNYIFAHTVAYIVFVQFSQQKSVRSLSALLISACDREAMCEI